MLRSMLVASSPTSPHLRSKLLILCLLCASLLCAQTDIFREQYASWDEFAATLATSLDDDGEEPTTSLLEELEELHATPLNINVATREDLLRIPFMDEARADSLLAYRERKGGYLRTLGEMQFVSSLDYDTRRYLSLFLYVGPSPLLATRRSTSLREAWREGRHEMSTLFAIPLYHTVGDVAHTPAQAESSPNKFFEGYRLANTTRYAYSYKHTLRYGLTLQKDSGEPFGTRGSHTYPFDYNGLYFYLRHRHYELAAGRYRLRLGQGLLMGGVAQQSRTGLLLRMTNGDARLSPHTGTDESFFLQGGAFTYTYTLPSGHELQLLGFVSAKPMDGTLRGDTITAFKTDGLHRTLTELRRRHTVNNYTAGSHVALHSRTHSLWQVGITGLYSHYSRTIYPVPQPYNLYYLRGREAAGLSADYHLRHHQWELQGELAMDRQAHLATTHTVRWHQGRRLSSFVQLRAFSPRFVSPWARTISQDSHTQNELAALLGAQWQPTQMVGVEGYAEYFRRPRASYRASQPSQGVEGHLQGRLALSREQQLTLRYRLKVKQQDITGHPLMQYVGTHRLRLQWDATHAHLDYHLSLDASLYATQTTSPSRGIMFSGRVRGHLPRRITLSAFGALFSAESYAARLYAYQPHLLRTSGTAAYANRGTSLALVADYAPIPWLRLGVQYNLLHYFNRPTCGSGLNETFGPTRHDLRIEAAVRL